MNEASTSFLKWSLHVISGPTGISVEKCVYECGGARLRSQQMHRVLRTRSFQVKSVQQKIGPIDGSSVESISAAKKVLGS